MQRRWAARVQGQGGKAARRPATDSFVGQQYVVRTWIEARLGWCI